MGLFWKRKKDENERPSHWPPTILPTTIPRVPQPPAVETAAPPPVATPVPEPPVDAPAETLVEAAAPPVEPAVPPPVEPPPLRKVDMNFTFGGYVTREPTPEEIEAERRTIYGRLKTAVTSTRHTLVDRIDLLVRGKKVIDAELLDGLEEALISADIGVQTALTFLIIFPLAGALAAYLASEKDAKTVALVAALIEFVVSLPLLFTYDPGAGACGMSVTQGLQSVVTREIPVMRNCADFTWLSQWGIHYRIGMDGISLFMVLLTTLLLPLMVLGSWTYIRQKERTYYASLLALTTGGN
jgi:hypothetical protein